VVVRTTWWRSEDNVMVVF